MTLINSYLNFEKKVIIFLPPTNSYTRKKHYFFTSNNSYTQTFIYFFASNNSYTKVKLVLHLLPPAHFSKTAGGIVLGSVAVSAVSAVPAVSAVSADVLPYISVAIKASFLKLFMYNICKNNIAKMFLDFF